MPPVDTTNAAQPDPVDASSSTPQDSGSTAPVDAGTFEDSSSVADTAAPVDSSELPAPDAALDATPEAAVMEAAAPDTGPSCVANYVDSTGIAWPPTAAYACNQDSDCCSGGLCVGTIWNSGTQQGNFCYEACTCPGTNSTCSNPVCGSGGVCRYNFLYKYVDGGQSDMGYQGVCGSPH